MSAKLAERRAARPPRKLRRIQPPKSNSILNKAVSLGTEITKLPHQAISAISKSL